MLLFVFIVSDLQTLQTALNMNKQPGKESVKDKVKAIFGLGTPRISTKPTEPKPSEFIITLDVLKV